MTAVAPRIDIPVATPRAGALRAWELGLNVTAIAEGGKKPDHDWSNKDAPWTTERQPKDIVLSLGGNWRTQGKVWNGRISRAITRFGIINGVAGGEAPPRSVDIDGIVIDKDAEGNPIKKPVPPAIRAALLAALGLPSGYDWSGPSSSGKGAHVWVRCSGELPPDVAQAERAKDDRGVIIFDPLPEHAEDFDHIELRWEHCQTVPPHPYGYTPCTLEAPPALVEVDALIAALRTVATPRQKGVKARQAPQARQEPVKAAARAEEPAVDVIGTFNRTYTAGDILERHGYTWNGDGWEHPHTSQPGVTGIKQAGDKVQSFSATDPLNNGHNHDAFSVFCLLEHGSDTAAAVKAAAEALGLPPPARKPSDPFTIDGDMLRCACHGHPLVKANKGHGWYARDPQGAYCTWVWAEDAAQALGTTEERTDPRPRIGVRDLDIPRIVAPAWDALIGSGALLFRRDGVLLELDRDDVGAMVLREVDKRQLRGYLARVALFVEEREKQGKTVSWVVEPPSSVLDDMLVRIDPRVPLITRITRCPIVAADGSIVDTPGYSPAARVFYDPRPGLKLPTIPTAPTPADVARARGLIDEMLADFPFVEEADRAHAVALFLLPFVREAIPGPTPLHLIEAPTPGSGKSLLASILTRPALGTEATPVTEGKDDADWQKKLTSVLSSTPTAVLIDNINRPLYGGALAAALTATVYSERLLGTNQMTAFPIRCAWLATANNPTMSGEIARRAIRIRIDPRIDRPWQRDGFRHPNLLGWVREHESELVAAALTLIRAGLAAPVPNQKPLGSFEHWTATMGRILGVAGYSGFLGNLDELYDRADSEGAAWRSLVAAWWETHGGATVGTGEIYDLFNAGDYDLNIDGKDDKGRRASFGRRLKKQQDRVIGGYQLVNAGTKQRTQQWQLRTTGPQQPTRRVVCVESVLPEPNSTHVSEKTEEVIPVHVERNGAQNYTNYTNYTEGEELFAETLEAQLESDPFALVEWDKVRAWLRDGRNDRLAVHCFPVWRVPLDDVRAEARRRWPELQEV